MKKYVKPLLVIELIATDTSICSPCKDCPTDVDCVNATNGTGAYKTTDGKVSFCNYGSKALGC